MLGKISSSVTKHWNRVPKEVGESPSLEVFKSLADVALRDMVIGGIGRVNFIVGLKDLTGLFQLK